MIALLVLVWLGLGYWVFPASTLPEQAKRAHLNSPRHIMGLMVNFLLGFIIGWSWVFGQTFFSVSLDERHFNQPLTMEAEVVGLPSISQSPSQGRVQTRLQFVVRILRIQHETHPEADPVVFKRPPLVQLSWYLTPERLASLGQLPAPNQQWQWQVKLRANHATMNLGAFDYEAWLYQNHLAAKGYVVDKPSAQYANRLLDGDRPSGMRYALAQRLDVVFADSPFKGLYQALSYGDKHAIDDLQWEVMQKTGTVHLMAISGLHMGIVAVLGFLLFKGLWWLGLYRCERLTLPVLGAFGALLFAGVYLVLAGYSIPTQRAFLMVLAVVLFLLVRRHFQPWAALALAALLVVLWEPRSVLSLGFWLSFLAVGLIFAILRQPWVRAAPRWQQLVWIQLALTLGLAPFLVWAFHGIPSFGFLANLLAVPFVSFIGLPGVFLVSLLGAVSVDLAKWWVAPLDGLWSILWRILEWIAQGDHAYLSLGGLPLWMLVAVYTLLFAVLLWRSGRAKAVSAVGLTVFLLLAWSWRPDARPANGQVNLHLLDVGQGQALILETRDHLLVYDTGARWGSGMDGSKMAILPFLHAHRWRTLNKVIVSHSDIDHAGGLARLVKHLPVGEVYSGQPEEVQRLLEEGAAQVAPCHAGQAWEWDGVVFEILSPGLPAIDAYLQSDNDRSCVLRVQAGQQTLLVTGDLGSGAEKRLLEQLQRTGREALLQANVLVAGHHGSRYSTSAAWLEQVAPKVVLFSAGYQNRFGFPHADTLARMPETVRWFNTACSGGIGFRLGGVMEEFSSTPLYQVRERQQKWYHHRCLPHEKGSLFQ